MYRNPEKAIGWHKLTLSSQTQHIIDYLSTGNSMTFEKASVVCAAFEMPCSPLKVSWPFGGTYRLRLQGRRVSRAGKRLEEDCACWQFHAGFLLDIVFDPEDRGDILQNPRLTFTGQHGIISLNIYISIVPSCIHGLRQSVPAPKSSHLASVFLSASLLCTFIFHATLTACLQPFYRRGLSLSYYTFQSLHIYYDSHVSHIFVCFSFCPVVYLQARVLKF